MPSTEDYGDGIMDDEKATRDPVRDHSSEVLAVIFSSVHMVGNEDNVPRTLDDGYSITDNIKIVAGNGRRRRVEVDNAREDFSGNIGFRKVLIETNQMTSSLLRCEKKFTKRYWEDFAYDVAGNKDAWTWFLRSGIGRNGVEHLKGDVGIVTRRLKMATLQRWKLKNNDVYDTPGTVLILLAREFLEVTRPLGHEENLPFAVICEAVIDAIPHDSWMKFVRLKLKLGENVIKALKQKHAGFSEEQKYQILKQWVLDNQDFHREDVAAE